MKNSEINIKTAITLFILLLLPIAAQSDDQDEDYFRSGVNQFIMYFTRSDWDSLSRFTTPTTKVGYGDLYGIEGVKAEFSGEGHQKQCFQDLVFALKQGCKYTERGDDKLTCYSPPQSADADVIYSGAQATFTFDFKKKTTLAEAVMCGLD